jgi:hypothetical protein
MAIAMTYTSIELPSSTDRFWFIFLHIKNWTLKGVAISLMFWTIHKIVFNLLNEKEKIKQDYSPGDPVLKGKWRFPDPVEIK